MFYEEFYIPCVVLLLPHPVNINLDGMQETVDEFRVCHNVLPELLLIKLPIISVRREVGSVSRCI